MTPGARRIARRAFLAASPLALGAIALRDLGARETGPADWVPHFAPRARRVISLFQAGGPAQQDLFDYKPLLNQRDGEELPESVRGGQRLTGMSGNQARLPLAGSRFRFARRGACGAWVSDLLPGLAGIADRLCFVKSMHTEAINHDPAITFATTGAEVAGRPSIGAWIQYGLGSANADLPAFVVMVSRGPKDQPIYERLWGSGFLPARYQGTQFRAGADAVLYLDDPPGIERSTRRHLLDAVSALDRSLLAATGDEAIASRIAQYELAFRMQTSVPEATDLSGEPAETFALYGEDAREPGSYAASCLLARRLAERGVRFIQIFHQGWDQHDHLPAGLAAQCRATDRASAALVVDLERRGLLEDTLVVWGGEFGRTSYSQGLLTADDYGRDHHPRCFTTWLAGAGVKAGLSHGETDEFGYNVAADPVHVHDLNATILHLLGLDHERLTFFHQGRHFRLTDVAGKVVRALLT